MSSCQAIVLRADARALPLPDASADLVVTSPPYFGLRSYTDDGEHYAGQIGSEATPQEYITNLLACTREWIRVLKPGGNLFVNLGDKYAGSASGGTQNGACGKRGTDGDRKRGHVRTAQGVMPKTEIRDKSLMGLPWRYALGCVDDLGLILRAEVVWAKPNGLPESVTDRVRRSHEQVFHFTKQPRYYAAVDEIREPHTSGDNDRSWAKHLAGLKQSGTYVPGNGETARADGRHSVGFSPLGKLPGSVWEIPSQPLTVPAHLGIDHFAAFPMELPRRIILGWSPPGICTACGEGRRPVADQERRVLSGSFGRYADAHGADGRTGARKAVTSTITGYACACPQPDAPTRPAVVLDPFGGTGTTALVAAAYGRTGVSADRSADYCRLARWRTTDPAERAKALQVPKPPPVPQGQGDLFDMEALA